MSKVLVWIDDKNDDMEAVARGAFIKLWKKGVFSRTVFFGDFHEKTSKDNLLCFKDTVIDLFNSVLIEDNNVYEERFINNNSHLTELKETWFDSESLKDNDDVIAVCIPDEDESECGKRINDIISRWKGIRSVDEILGGEDGKVSKEYSVKTIFEEIENPGKYVYALDLVLLKGDEEKLNRETNEALPVVSMDLYHYITNVIKAPCVLYSRYTYLNQLQYNWKTLYKMIYNEDFNDNILDRRFLQHGSCDNATLGLLVDLFKGREEK